MSIAASDRNARALQQDRQRRPRLSAGLIALLDRALRAGNRILIIPCMLAMGVAAALLTAGVVARYFLHAPTDWQEETSVLLPGGATVLSGAYVQFHRG